MVTLGDVSSKKNILKQATKLHNSTSWSNVFISPDLIPKEREVNKRLREELKSRKEAGEKNLMIRRGKIVVDTRKDSEKSPQSSSWLDSSPVKSLRVDDSHTNVMKHSMSPTSDLSYSDRCVRFPYF